MKVEVRLFTSFTQYLPHRGKAGNSCTIELFQEITVRELLDHLKIPRDEIKVMFLNGVHATGDETLREGDRVAAFPPIGGG